MTMSDAEWLRSKCTCGGDCHDERARLAAVNMIMRETLQQIARADYRGNRPSESVLAEDVLKALANDEQEGRNSLGFAGPCRSFLGDPPTKRTSPCLRCGFYKEAHHADDREAQR